ncbi:MAG: hypothetical protein ABH832_04015 [bacterium]
MSEHTLDLFRRLYNHVENLIPDDLAEQMSASLKNFEKQDEPSLEEVERHMIDHGYEVWPYWQAYKEFLHRAEEQLYDHFLVPHLGDATAKKVKEYGDYGGGWHDLYFGKPADFFDSEERVELMTALVEARNKMREHVHMQIKGVEQENYLQRVGKYREIMMEMRTEIEDLRKMAGKEDHSALAGQMRAKVQDIEHSLCTLGQELKYHELKNAKEFFEGRKQELGRLRGIDIPKNIDFYYQAK